MNKLALFLVLVPALVSAQECPACVDYLGKFIGTITSDVGADFQVDYLVNDLCLEDYQCQQGIKTYWRDLQATMKNAEFLPLLCGSIGASENCDEWDNLTCDSCQARIDQFGTIFEDIDAVGTYISALQGELFCIPKCQGRENEDSCLENCSYSVGNYAPLAFVDLTVLTAVESEKACNLVFDLCE